MKAQTKETIYNLLSFEIISSLFLAGTLTTLYIRAIYHGDASDAIMWCNSLMALPFVIFGLVSCSLLRELFFGEENDEIVKSACFFYWGVFSLIGVILLFNNFITPLLA